MEQFVTLLPPKNAIAEHERELAAESLNDMAGSADAVAAESLLSLPAPDEVYLVGMSTTIIKWILPMHD